jgi:uncharacterized protein YndB with AHSA1/START domain
MTRSTVVHSTFTIERSYPVAPDQAFRAFADPTLKAKWFAMPQDAEGAAYELDFRVGGGEINRGAPQGDTIYAFESRFHEIVPAERIVFAYDMYIGGQRVSVSLTTVELLPDGDGTKLVFTEHGAFFDGLDDPDGREHGTGKLLEALESVLTADSAQA